MGTVFSQTSPENEICKQILCIVSNSNTITTVAVAFSRILENYSKNTKHLMVNSDNFVIQSQKKKGQNTARQQELATLLSYTYSYTSYSCFFTRSLGIPYAGIMW